MKRILIIEDDELIAELERDYLEAGGFEVEMELDGREGLKKALTGEYDAMILDLMLPGINGFEICRKVREKLNLPVIMVTARKEDIDKIRGLGLGADDYMVKPFSPAEMVARVRSHIRIHEQLLGERKAKERAIQIRDLEIFPQERRVYRKQREVSLTNKEFELLLFLIENPNIVFSKDTLFGRILGLDSTVTSATV